MTTYLTRQEWQKLAPIKYLDLQVCDFCGKVNILNLGWPAFWELHCQACQIKHVLCPELCLPMTLNVLDCHLFEEFKPVRPEVVPANRAYDWASCYLCGEELRGASKKGVVKNRNNPSFWGIKSEWKILCLGCLGRKYLSKLSESKRRTWRKYVKRGYV